MRQRGNSDEKTRVEAEDYRTYDHINRSGIWVGVKPSRYEIGLKLFKDAEENGDKVFVLKEMTIEGIVKNEVMIHESEVDALMRDISPFYDRLNAVMGAIISARRKNHKDWAENHVDYAYGCRGILEYIMTGDIEKILLPRIAEELEKG